MKTRTRELLVLMMTNPELKILPMVQTECVNSDDCSYWAAEWGKSEIDEYLMSDERIYFKSVDYDELIQEYMDIIAEKYKLALTEEEIKEMVEVVVDNFEWIKAIVVHIDSIN